MANFFMCFLSFLLHFSVSECNYMFETSIDLSRFSKKLKKDEEVCISAHKPRLYLMMYKAPNVVITLQEFDSETSTNPTASETFSDDNLTAYLFNNYGRVSFKAQEDTTLMFSAIELDSNCNDLIWYSTFSYENFHVKRNGCKNPDYCLKPLSEACVFFGSPDIVSYTLISKQSIEDEESRIEIHEKGKDTVSIKGKSFKKDLISHNVYFKVVVSESASVSGSFRILTSEYEEKASVVFRGFQGDSKVPIYNPTQDPKPEVPTSSDEPFNPSKKGSSSTVTTVALTIGSIVIIISIILIFVAMNKRRRRDKYISVPNVQISF